MCCFCGGGRLDNEKTPKKTTKKNTIAVGRAMVDRSLSEGCSQGESNIPVNRPCTSHMVKREAESKQHLEQTEHGYNTLWWPEFHCAYRFWTSQIRYLVTIAMAGLFKCHPPVRKCFRNEDLQRKSFLTMMLPFIVCCNLLAPRGTCVK